MAATRTSHGVCCLIDDRGIDGDSDQPWRRRPRRQSWRQRRSIVDGGSISGSVGSLVDDNRVVRTNDKEYDSSMHHSLFILD